MAYSDYGAFVWKNGENITKQTCDLSNDFSGGHATLDFGDFYIEFYKVYEPQIKFHDESKKYITINCLQMFNAWYNKKLDIWITGWKLDSFGNVNVFRLSHGKDKYFIICGNSVGNGFDKNHLSRYLLKNVYYDCDKKAHYIKTRFDVSDMDVADKLIRKDDVDFERHITWEFGTKPFLKELLKFKFDTYYFNNMLEGLYKIHLKK